MLLDVFFRAIQALFFASKQNEANGAFGLYFGFHQGTRRFEHGHRACAVVRGAGAEIPGIKMRANDDDLIGFFGAGDFGDGVVHLYGIFAETGFDFDFGFDAARVGKAPELTETFAASVSGSEGRRFVFAREGRHVFEAVQFFRTEKNCAGFFFVKKCHLGANGFHVRAKIERLVALRAGDWNCVIVPRRD